MRTDNVATRKKVVILCVDKDADIWVANKNTPIIGYNNVLKLAVDFALLRPEDSDSNALFSALNIYQKLKREGYDVEIAVIAGDPVDDLKAGLRIKQEVLKVKEITKADAAVMVSDGKDDEVIVPVIYSILPIESIKRVVVEQARGVEETYILIGKYLRKIFEEPRFSKIFLGVPGIIILLSSILTAFGLLDKAILVALGIIGLTMIFRGFSLDRKFEEWWESSPVIFASAVISLLSITLGFVYTSISLEGYEGISAIGRGVYVMTPFIIFSVISLLGGKAIVKIIRRDIKIWHEAVGFVFIVFLYQILNIVSNIIMEAAKYPEVDVTSIILKSNLFIWLGLAIGVTGLLTGIFTLIEKSVREDILRRRAILSLQLRAKLKKLKAKVKRT
ncbi:MAG: hypothetical protein B6U76_04345 [Desulfurococcales archaeon ex4484_217_2]|nr:MAG: hypothetical protein B6U76_04345 [Desulfurococcales archaeon ex4484_217_2]